MKRITVSLKYMLKTYRLDMLWLPAAFWALFLILTWMLRDEQTGYTITVSFFGVALPLISGILAAYAVLEDPALELQFAAPRPVWAMLAERLGMILVLAAFFAFAYQGGVALLSVDLSPLGSFGARQLAWLVPTLTMMALSSVCSFALRQAVAGAALTGLIWFTQLIFRSWFLENRYGQYLLLMMGSNYPDHLALHGNQIVLAGLGLALLIAAWALLRRQERYIG